MGTAGVARTVVTATAGSVVGPETYVVAAVFLDPGLLRGDAITVGGTAVCDAFVEAELARVCIIRDAAGKENAVQGDGRNRPERGGRWIQLHGAIQNVRTRRRPRMART